MDRYSHRMEPGSAKDRHDTNDTLYFVEREIDIHKIHRNMANKKHRKHPEMKQIPNLQWVHRFNREIKPLRDIAEYYRIGLI